MSAGKPETDFPVDLFEQARRRLLVNQPLSYTGIDQGAAAALSAGEVEALASVGLSTSAWAEDAGQDPLLRTVADYMALLDTSFTTAQAAAYLRVDVSRIRQRVRERSLFGIDYDAERRLPRFQFERQQVLPGLREVLGALPDPLNPLDVAEWFLAPHPDLELDLEHGAHTVSPREWLLRAMPVETVVALARALD